MILKGPYHQAGIEITGMFRSAFRLLGDTELPATARTSGFPQGLILNRLLVRLKI